LPDVDTWPRVTENRPGTIIPSSDGGLETIAGWRGLPDVDTWPRVK
jgi:hypothetical protein